jgi:orotate phosphoribosyltransferase-like protein
MITELGEKIVNLRRKGMPVKQIARELKCGIGSVSKFAMLADNHESQILDNILEANKI